MPYRPTWRMWVTAAAVAATGAAGCASAATQPRPRGAARTASATHRASPSPGSSRAGRAAGNITLAFAGDVHFTGRTAKLLRRPATAFGPIAALLRSADLTVVNLETAVTSGGTPQPKYYHFRTRPAAFTALRDAGVDIANMANNHVLDYGRTGLADTLAAARAAHFPVLGIGANAAAAWSPYIVTVKGVKIAFLGVSQVAELASSWVATKTRSGEAHAINLRRTLAAVRAARKVADVVIVIMHWGTEGQACPDANQLALAPKLARAGANIIVGSHAHVLQGSGWLGRTFVAYGMANFLWWEASYSTNTGVLLLTLHRHGPLSARFVPATVSATGQPIIDTGRAARQARAHYRRLRSCTQLSAQPSSGPRR
ncbi:MAG TPA: CapA family protein [Streptosporangiaceae bacterium]|nr:CapA family protein [Streptosporangiaceae bacterium]